MTAIVGLVHDGQVHIGGDSASVSGWTMTVRADAKVFTKGPFVFGFTTSFRMGQLIRYAADPPTPDPADLDAFMATKFVDAIRNCLKAGGWAKKTDEREEGGIFLVGTCGRLFSVYADYQVGEAVDGYAAVGCGDEIALGALYASTGSGLTPRARLELALQAAQRFSAGVRGPFAFASLPVSTSAHEGEHRG